LSPDKEVPTRRASGTQGGADEGWRQKTAWASPFSVYLTINGEGILMEEWGRRKGRGDAYFIHFISVYNIEYLLKSPISFFNNFFNSFG